nr:MAG TPA_asm: hypothetical protein [Caudoviricetes sp.]
MITLRQLLSSQTNGRLQVNVRYKNRAWMNYPCEILDILKDREIIKIYPSEFKDGQIPVLDVEVR